MVLISPRRWGKTSLVKKVCKLAQTDKLKIVYLDIFFCRTDKEFYDAIASVVLKQTSSKFDELMENAKLFLPRISQKFTIGADSMTDFSIADRILYICEHFESTGKSISKELAERVCLTVDNHSSYVQ